MVPLRTLLDVIELERDGADAAILILDDRGTLLGSSPAASGAAQKWTLAGRQDLSLALGDRTRMDWTDGQVRGELVRLSVQDGAPPLFMLRRAAVDGPTATDLKPVAMALENLLLHDLRVLIQSLLGGVERLSEESGHAADQMMDLRELADIAVRHIGVGLSLKSDDISGLPRPVRVDLPRLVGNLVRQLKPYASAAGRALEFEKSEFPVALSAPEGLILALAQNMIANAVHHGAGEVEVRLCARPVGEAAWAVGLEVWQNGDGVTEEVVEKLRQPWMRPKLHGTATGYGLEIERLAMILLDGRWDRVATPARSALRAEFVLPEAGLATVDEQGLEATEEIALPVQRDRPLGDTTVLVVEDQSVSRKWIVQVLRNAGAAVTAVSDGEGALLLIRDRQTPFDFAIVDVGLPRMSGIALVQRLHAEAKIVPPRHIIGLTGHDDPEILAECHAAGMEIVLQKPLQSSDLRASLIEVVRGELALADQPAGTPSNGSDETMTDLLDREVVGELEAELGKDATLAFLHRAVEEAERTLQFVRDCGYGAETRPMLHATVGSVGITGLSAIERALRQIQRVGEDDALRASAVNDLEVAVRKTRALLE